MIQATNLKAGITFQEDGKPYKVVKYAHSKIGRGGANVKISARNLNNGNLEEKTYNATHKVEEIQTSKKTLQYLYHDASGATFMDKETFEQVEVPQNVFGDDLVYIKEGHDVDVLFWSFGGAQDKEDVPLSIEIPPKVTLVVTQTAPGVKGDTSSNAYKPAKLENGLEVKVPLFVKSGDKIRVDTRNGEYVERAR